MPSSESGGTGGNSWYSYDVSGVHVVVLNAYVDTSSTSAQYAWLERDLSKVDRLVTPWVVAGSHCPWYNSNGAHHNEKGTLSMQAAMEPLFAKHGVDIAFAGHVHAYERMYRTLNNKTVPEGTRGPGTVYINIGDGGNREGRYDHWLNGVGSEPNPVWSAARRPEFGHGKLTLANATHAQWTWHRTLDGEKIISDQTWIVRYDAAHPPAPSPPAPAPTPGAMVWECHDDVIVDVKKLTGVTWEVDILKKTELAACEYTCDQNPGCAAIYAHGSDKHCYIVISTPPAAANPTHAQFMAALKKDKNHVACIRVPKPPASVNV